MRKMKREELHELGWLFGLWDNQESQWDAISVDEADPDLWIDQIAESGDPRYQVYDLSTGKKI